MNDRRGDTELRSRFHALRDEVSPGMPAFRPVPVRPVVRPAYRWTVAFAGIAAVVLVGLLTRRGTYDVNSEYALSLDAVVWVAPTDFLLETPGRYLLSEVPTFDVSEYTAPPVNLELDRPDTSS